MQELLDAYNKDLDALLTQRAELDEKIAARNAQYAADVEAFVHKSEPAPVDPPQEKTPA